MFLNITDVSNRYCLFRDNDVNQLINFKNANYNKQKPYYLFNSNYKNYTNHKKQKKLFLNKISLKFTQIRIIFLQNLTDILKNLKKNVPHYDYEITYHIENNTASLTSFYC